MNGGVPFGRIRAFGRGEDQPVASNLTPEGKRQNRRVEIVILPN
jgi:outer membrane protein OmpA-like peptidoglycan-associated protein